MGASSTLDEARSRPEPGTLHLHTEESVKKGEDPDDKATANPCRWLAHEADEAPLPTPADCYASIECNGLQPAPTPLIKARDLLCGTAALAACVRLTYAIQSMPSRMRESALVGRRRSATAIWHDRPRLQQRSAARSSSRDLGPPLMFPE